MTGDKRWNPHLGLCHTAAGRFALTARSLSWERPQQPSAPSSLLKEQQGLFLFFFFSKVWPLGSAMHTQKCDVACGEQSRGPLGNIVRHFTSSVTFCRTTCQHIWGTESQKPGTLSRSSPPLSFSPPPLSLSWVFPYSSHCLCIDSINSPCLLPTFGWEWEAVLAEMLWWGGCQRMLLLTHQFLVLLGRPRPGPHLAWKGTFSEFSVCHLGCLYLSYFPNKLLNFIWLLWLWWGEELETGCTSSTEIWCVRFLI